MTFLTIKATNGQNFRLFYHKLLVRMSVIHYKPAAYVGTTGGRTETAVRRAERLTSQFITMHESAQSPQHPQRGRPHTAGDRTKKGNRHSRDLIL